jgi:glycosyltransferase involved in cell wall biosynthesis
LADPSTVSVVIPALNEADAIGGVVSALLAAAPWREVIVVDDGSDDATGAAAAAAGARVIRHPYNKGNGAAVKTGIRSASGEFVLIVDADGQHAPADARTLTGRLGEFDLVVGARSAATQATAGRRAGNALLNALAGYMTGRDVPDLTSGFRGARRDCLLEFLHLLPNGFSTPTTTTLAFVKAGYNVAFVPVDARARAGRSKIKFARDGAKFLLILLKVITLFSPLRIFAPIAGGAFALGTLYGLINVAVQGRLPNGSVLLILFSVIVLLVGLVSEQIASLRLEGPRGR